MAYVPGSNLRSVNVNGMNESEIDSAIDLINKKIDALEGNEKQNSPTITKLNSLLKDMHKAQKKIQKFFAENSDLRAYHERTLSIREINQKINNAEGNFAGKEQIEEVNASAGSVISNAAARTGDKLSRLGSILKIVAGTALSLTGIGLIFGIPLLKNASKHRKMLRKRDREAIKVERELRDIIRDQKGSSATFTNLYEGKGLTPEQINFLMDHPEELAKLRADANQKLSASNPKTKNFGFTRSQQINLIGQLKKLDEKQNAAKNSQLKTQAEDKQWGKFESKLNTAKNKGISKELLDYILSENPDPTKLPKSEIGKVTVDPTIESNYNAYRAVARSKCPTESAARDTALKTMDSELLAAIVEADPQVKDQMNLRDVATDTSKTSDLKTILDKTTGTFTKAEMVAAISKLTAQIESIEHAIKKQSGTNPAQLDALKNKANAMTAHMQPHPDTNTYNITGTYAEFNELKTAYNAVYADMATVNVAVSGGTKTLKEVVESAKTNANAAYTAKDANLKNLIQKLENNEELSANEVSSAKQLVLNSSLPQTRKDALIAKIVEKASAYEVANNALEGAMKTKGESIPGYKEAVESYNKAAAEECVKAQQGAEALREEVDKLRKLGFSEKQIREKMQEMEMEAQYNKI